MTSFNIGNKFGIRISWLLFLMLISFLVSIGLSFLVVKIEGLSFFDLVDTSATITNGHINILKWFQIIQSVFLFVVPAWFFAYFIGQKPADFLSLNQGAHRNTYLLVFLLMAVMFPVNNYIAEWNRNLSYPDALSGLHNWMLQQETTLSQITEEFLKIHSPADFWVNFLMIAIIPAIGEELIFRGVLQRLFSDWTKNVHWGIWIAAFLFSAIHMEFLTFIPRFLLGAMFGYLYVWSQSLWLPIFAHFLNNGTAVVIASLEQTHKIPATIETAGQQSYWAFFYGMIAIGILYLIFRQEKRVYRG